MVKQLIRLIKLNLSLNTGMSENQARQAAKARGYSDDQINDLIKKKNLKIKNLRQKIL